MHVSYERDIEAKNMERTRIEEVTKLLVDTALGREKADLIVRGDTLVNVNSRELLENVDVAVKKSRIAIVGEVSHTIGSNTVVIDAEGKYVAPGFLDGHVHVESSMLTLTQFARAICRLSKYAYKIYTLRFCEFLSIN